VLKEKKKVRIEGNKMVDGGKDAIKEW